MWDIVWVSPQGHRPVSVSRHFLLQAPQRPRSVRKRPSRDHRRRGRPKPGRRTAGPHTRREPTTRADLQPRPHWPPMPTGHKPSHNGPPDASPQQRWAKHTRPDLQQWCDTTQVENKCNTKSKLKVWTLKPWLTARMSCEQLSPILGKIARGRLGVLATSTSSKSLTCWQNDGGASHSVNKLLLLHSLKWINHCVL